MPLTEDPSDPRLTHGVDDKPVPQAEVYLVLSEEERAKGFVRPLRMSYTHIGPAGPKYPLRDLTPEEHEHYDKYDYIKYEEYPSSTESSVIGSFWTQARLDAVGKGGCGVSTRMGLALCETYARKPDYYGSTYCVGCSMHLPVAEFVWDEDKAVVGT